MDRIIQTLVGHGAPPAAAAALAAAAGPSRMVRAGERLRDEGASTPGLALLVAGIAKACRSLDDGAAQTLALFTQGDLLDSQGYVLGRSPVTLAAVTVSRVSEIPRARIEALIAEYPALHRALWRLTARDAAILQEWMVGMGRRTAYRQIAHLMCEMALRMRVAGRMNGNAYDFPLTQAELADTVGLSPVHVNRILQQLRAEGLIALSKGALRIGDWSRLAETADFDPSYLELPGAAAPAPPARVAGQQGAPA